MNNINEIIENAWNKFNAGECHVQRSSKEQLRFEQVMLKPQFNKAVIQLIRNLSFEEIESIKSK